MTRGKRKRRTFGTLTERTRGTWCLQWWANTPQGRVRRSETVYGSRREAEYRLAQIQAETRLGDPLEATVGDVFDMWWDVRSESFSGNTSKTYRAAWTKHVEPRWAHVPVSQVKRGDVQAWLLGLSGNARMARVVLSMVLGFACDDLELVPKNPAAGKFRLPKVATECRDVYTAAELDRICEAAHGMPIEVAVILMAQGGVRVGESMGVLVGEVTEGIGGGFAVVSISRQVTQQDTIDKPKTASSVRTVPIVGAWGARLLELHDEARARGDKWLMDDGIGRPYPRRFLETRWAALLDSLGWPHRPMRILRPSWETSRHWEMGVPLELTSKGMGHSTVKTTLGHYDRPQNDVVANALADAQLKSS